MKNIAIIICLHGDELFGLEVMDKLDENIPVFIGNPKAIQKKVRYIDIDLNRAFPGKKDGNYEERRAFYLMNKLKKFKHVIDIHSSSSNLELFGILTEPNKEKLQLAKKLGLKKIVLMSEKLANGNSLIDNHDCAISLEIGPHEKKENVDEVIKIINNPSNHKDDYKSKMFKVFDIIKGNETKLFIKNFQEVKKGELITKDMKAEFDFIPVFVGEKAYKNIICLAAKLYKDKN